MMTRLANVKKVAGVTAMAAVLTAAGWGVGSATAQAAPHPHPDPGMTPTAATPDAAGNPDAAGKPDDTGNPDHVKGFKGLLIINSSGIPIAFIPPGTENAGRFIHILVQCHAHESRAQVNNEGIHVLVCH